MVHFHEGWLLYIPYTQLYYAQSNKDMNDSEIKQHTNIVRRSHGYHSFGLCDSSQPTNIRLQYVSALYSVAHGIGAAMSMNSHHLIRGNNIPSSPVIVEIHIVYIHVLHMSTWYSELPHFHSSWNYSMKNIHHNHRVATLLQSTWTLHGHSSLSDYPIFRIWFDSTNPMYIAPSVPLWSIRNVGSKWDRRWTNREGMTDSTIAINHYGKL